MKYLKILIITCFVVTLNTGCEVPTAVALRDEIKPTETKSFRLRSDGDAPNSIRFVNNRLFLWKQDETPEQMSRVLSIDTWIDDHEVKASNLRAKIVPLEEKIAPTLDAIKKKNMAVNIAGNNIKRRVTDIAKLDKSLAAIHASLDSAMTRQPPDTVSVDSLRAQIKAAEDKRLVLQNERTKFETDLRVSQSELASLNNDADLVERNRLVDIAAQDESKGQENTAEITRLVDWYDSPPTTFLFTLGNDGAVKQVIIEGWVLEKGEKPLDFTSTPSDGSKPTIINAQYEELGGVFQFEILVYKDPAQTQVAEKYSFRVARLKYDSNDGRVYLAGKFIRTVFKDDGTSELRDGFAKLIDKNN